MKYAIGQHGAAIAQLASALEEINSLQAELTTVQNDVVSLQTQLKDALGQHGTTVAKLASAQEEITNFQVDLQTTLKQNKSYTQDLENARQKRSRLLDELHEEQQSDELLKELIATNESLEKASATRVVAETELIILREAASKSSTAEAKFKKVSAKLNVLKEVEAKLAESIAQLQRLSLHSSKK
jgi:chromosome segregation ATPase